MLGGAWPPVLALTVLVSLAASLQTTLVYLSRSLFAMGRDGLLPHPLGALDRRAEPAAAIALVTAFSLAFCLAAGSSPSASAAFDFALQGTSWFLGLLFVLSAAAAVRAFAGDRRVRWSGAVLPGAAGLVLGAILSVSLLRDDTGTRGFIALSAIIGLPLALWRGRFVRRADQGGLYPGVGSFERQRNRFDA